MAEIRVFRNPNRSARRDWEYGDRETVTHRRSVAPGVLVVSGAGDALVAEVEAGAPAEGFEDMEEVVGVVEMAQALLHADVEPDAEGRAGRDGLEQRRDERQDAAFLPPKRGREDGELVEGGWVPQAEVERDEAAERGASEAGVLGLGAGAVGAVEEWLDLFEEEAAVAVALAAAVAWVGGGGVLGHAAKAGVGDADEDEGLDEAPVDEAIGGGVRPPGMAGDEGGAVVEEVLAVVEIEDGEAVVGVFEVGAGENGMLGNGMVLWVACDNADAFHDLIVERGGKVVEPLSDGPFGRFFVARRSRRLRHHFPQRAKLSPAERRPKRWQLTESPNPSPPAPASAYSSSVRSKSGSHLQLPGGRPPPPGLYMPAQLSPCPGYAVGVKWPIDLLNLWRGNRADLHDR